MGICWWGWCHWLPQRARPKPHRLACKSYSLWSELVDFRPTWTSYTYKHCKWLKVKSTLFNYCYFWVGGQENFFSVTILRVKWGACVLQWTGQEKQTPRRDLKWTLMPTKTSTTEKLKPTLLPRLWNLLEWNLYKVMIHVFKAVIEQ